MWRECPRYITPCKDFAIKTAKALVQSHDLVVYEARTYAVQRKNKDLRLLRFARNDVIALFERLGA